MLHFFLFFILLLPSFLPSGFSDFTTDRTALLTFRAAVRGRTLQWNSSTSTPCLWKGVKCDTTINAVTELRLPGAGLSGQIPIGSIGNLTNLLVLSLRGNSLSGTLPSDLSLCTQMSYLYLQGNNFSGNIPATLFTLNNLVRLSLSNNSFSGVISSEFNKLTGLKTLLLGNNQLTGSLPDLKNLTALTNIDVSSNKLNGSIPNFYQTFPANSFLNNALCGSPLNSCPAQQSDDSKLSNGAIVGIVVGSISALLFVILLSFILCRKYRIRPHSAAQSPQTLPEIRSRSIKTETENRGFNSGVSTAAETSENVSGNNGLVFFNERVNTFGFEELLRASAEVMGKDSKFGSTYKAYLDGGNVVVVKRLKNVGVSVGEFTEKVEKLGNLNHQNLVPLKGYFSGREEKLLVYDFIPMGSLSAVLHGNRGAEKQELNWEVRTRIAYQVALAIKHLHSQGIIHGNIKSSNILLKDYQYNSSVADYGIAQLQSSSTSLISNGYVAPEVTKFGEISQEADVYSVGVLLLEMLLGKAPVNPITGAKIDLPKRGIAMAEGNLGLDVFDQELLNYSNIKEKLYKFLFVAISCTAKDPEGRPTMEKVTGLLNKIHILTQEEI